MASTITRGPSPRRKELFLVMLRALTTAYQSFVELDNRLLRPTGLTQTQFDIVATLGNTSGMTMRELSQKTLVTKGALTGVIDRLTAKGIVERRAHPTDRRCFIVALTSRGDALFETVFPPHVSTLREILAAIDENEQRRLAEALGRLDGVLRGAVHAPSTSTIK